MKAIISNKLSKHILAILIVYVIIILLTIKSGFRLESHENHAFYSYTIVNSYEELWWFNIRLAYVNASTTYLDSGLTAQHDPHYYGEYIALLVLIILVLHVIDTAAFVIFTFA